MFSVFFSIIHTLDFPVRNRAFGMDESGHNSTRKKAIKIPSVRSFPHVDQSSVGVGDKTIM